MKILQVSPRYYPSLGGVEELVKQYSERLVRDFGHDVTVFTTDVDSDGSRELNGVKIDRFWTIPRFKRAPFLRVSPGFALKLLTSNFDIWHLHANKRFTTDAAAILNLTKKTPFVFTTHAGQFGTSFLGRLHNKTVGTLAFRAKVVIFDTEFERNLVTAAGMRFKNSVILPVGVDPNRFKHTDMSIKETFHLEKDKVVLFVGRLASHKGVDTLLKAFSRVLKKTPNVKLLVVGPDFGEGQNYKDLAKSLNIQEKVVFTGRLSDYQLNAAYKLADVFCLPSRSEAFGMVSVEAFAAGVPVVAAKNTAIPEVVKDGVNGLLFETDNSEELAEKITTLLNDNKLVAKLVNNAAADVAEKYNWEKIVQKLNTIYQEVVS